jgi:hypothetical protein
MQVGETARLTLTPDFGFEFFFVFFLSRGLR